MYPSLLRVPSDMFADYDHLQRQVEQLFGPRGWPSSIRAVGRRAFPAINVGTTADAVEIFAFVPGIDPKKLEVSVDKGLLTIAGEREVKQALRRTLFKYKLHQEQELFDRAYAYVAQYY